MCIVFSYSSTLHRSRVRSIRSTLDDYNIPSSHTHFPSLSLPSHAEAVRTVMISYRDGGDPNLLLGLRLAR